MTEDKGILIHNIFYMLTYAFQELRQNNYEKIEGEIFDNIHDLFAEILSIGIAFLLKQGLRKEYISKHETLSSLKGKLDINGSVKNLSANKRKLDCDYDELSEDNLFNQILKTTSILLIKHGNENKTRKIDGMLLYAQTQSEGEMNFKSPHNDGNMFYVKSLDLNQKFDSIKKQLDSIIKMYE